VSPRVATTGVFLANGAVIGAWVANIPWVQERFGLSKTEVGLLILGLSAGVMGSILLSGQAVMRHGTRRVALIVAGVIPCLRGLGAGSTAEGDDAPGFTLPSRGVALIAGLCLILMITEGAMADWGGIYLRQDLGAGASLTALAYAFFAAGLTVGRLVGDEINRRIGPIALLRGGAVLTGGALAAVLLVGEPAIALAGLFVVGLGVANGVPLMFSAAGRQLDTPPGPGIAAVSSMGSLGFLAGPAFIGPAADAVSLPWALSVLILGAVMVGALARRAAGGGAMDAQGPSAESRDAVAV